MVDRQERQMLDNQSGRNRSFRVGLCCILALIFWLWGAVAYGFVIDETLTNNTPNNPADDLQGVARWSNVPGSVASNIRGLGEGLEYAIAPDFCSRIIPLFADTKPPTCDQIQTSIQTAMAHWGQDHPSLTFKNVTSQRSAQLPPQGDPEPWRGFGAEIDLFVLSPQDYPFLADFGAYTSFWYLNENPIGLQGRPLPGKTITSADIVFSNQACYFWDPRKPIQGCNHFESLLAHEVGHALSLDHPNEFPQRNFDTDNRLGNVMSIDCQNPTKSLKLSTRIDPQAIMNSSLGQSLGTQTQLSVDDLGGRNFLYPICQARATAKQLSQRPPSWQLFGVLLLGSFTIVFGTTTLMQQGDKRRRRRYKSGG